MNDHQKDAECNRGNVPKGIAPARRGFVHSVGLPMVVVVQCLAGQVAGPVRRPCHIGGAGRLSEASQHSTACHAKRQDLANQRMGDQDPVRESSSIVGSMRATGAQTPVASAPSGARKEMSKAAVG